MSMDKRSLSALADGLRRGEFSSRELCEYFLAEIAKKDGEIGAFLTVSCDHARAAADECDRRRACGELPDGASSALFGIPFAAKDNICTRGIRTTCASRMLEHFVPPYDATVMTRLAAAGGVLLGKLNMDEFAMGASTEYSALQVTRNPRDLSRVPGGSSGGSAAAVAAGLAPYALGSDTGGSVRNPAAFCGVVGMKPTYGAVSRYGLVAFASSLDQIGPITRGVRDNALVLSALVGRDPHDATSLDHSTLDFCADLDRGVRGLRIGIPAEFFGEDCAPDVRHAVLRAADVLATLGATLVPLSLPSFDVALAAYYVLSSAEASSNLSRFDGVRYGHRAAEYEDIESLYCRSRGEGFGREVKRRILAGTLALSVGYYDAYYQKANEARKKLQGELLDVLCACDVILSPTVPTVAHRFGERQDPAQMLLGDRYTVSANLAGLPALSLPCGTGEGGLPIGMQLMGAPFSEALLYRVAYAYECETKGGDAHE